MTMQRMAQAMDNIMSRRIAKNPNIAKVPMVRAMMNSMSRRGMTPQVQTALAAQQEQQPGMKKGGKVKKLAKGGTARDEDKGVVDRALGTKFGFSKGGSVSKRADGCAVKGKTKGRFV